jgi:CubicO group peptidase (beta-lactamase class C family)
MHRLLSLILTLFLFQPGVGTGQTPLPDTFDEFILSGMEQWDIPGMAIAIVKDDSVVFANGYGIRKMGEEAAVDEHTLFGIASVSKNMTAASLALLVDEGLISWDDRVRDYLPWFELSDPWVSDEVRIRDLLIHRVGAGRMLGNRLQFMTNEPRKELIYRMRYHEFEEPFRSGYVYSNVMYMVAGEIVAAVSGMSWDEFMVERLFSPLGMDRTNTSIHDIAEDENAAWPHQYIRGEVQTIPRRSWDNAAPAGGVNSSVYEVAQWLRMQLETPGSYDGTRILSAQSMREMHRPQIVLPIRNPYGSQVSYGLGWSINDYEGERMLSHGGATDGMNTSAVLLPEHNLGVVVITNVFTNFREAVVNTILDRYLDIPERNWNELYWNNYQSRYADAMEIRKEIDSNRIEGTNTTLEISEYTGRFTDSQYGDVEVKNGNNGLELHFWDDPDLIADLEHWHHDTFRAVWRNPAQREEFLHFTLNQAGEIGALVFQFTLRPLLLQAGAYPTNYYRKVEFKKGSNR